MRNFVENKEASAVPILLFVMTIFGVGFIYTILFIFIAPYVFYPLIPAGDFKIVYLGMCYCLPLLILLVGFGALIQEGLKSNSAWRGF